MLGQGYAALRPNGRWGRAILEDVVETNDLVTVLFVDYGDTRAIPRSSLRQLRER
jgi:Tudor domain